MATWLYIHTTSRNLPFPRDFIQYHYDMTRLLDLHRIKSASTSQARFSVVPRPHFPSSLGYLSSLKAKFPPKKKKPQTALATPTEGVRALHLNTLPFSPLKAMTRWCFAPISVVKIQYKKYKHTKNCKRNQTWSLPDEYMDKTLKIHEFSNTCLHILIIQDKHNTMDYFT
jgi:hypothetical protein